MRRALPILLLILCVNAVAASAAAAQTPAPTPQPTPVPTPEPRIRAAVTVSGIDVGNLTLAQAQLRLEQTLEPAFARDIVVTVARRRFRLRMSDIGFVFRADKTAQRAFDAGQAAPPLPDGTLPPAAAKPSVRFERKPLWRFVMRTGKAVGIPPRNATLRITLTRMIKQRARKGHKMGRRALVETIKATLANPRAPRALRPGRRTIVPRVRTRELKRIYRTVITIDRAHFRLRLFKRLKFVKGYGVAVGMPAYPTPTGLFAIQTKQVNPTWTAPNSPWAGELAGQQIAGGAPDNPLRARWMGVTGSVGIHGTGQPWTIGTRASHGCIRMTVPDVIRLYRRVPIGTPVLIQ